MSWSIADGRSNTELVPGICESGFYDCWRSREVVRSSFVLILDEVAIESVSSSNTGEHVASNHCNLIDALREVQFVSDRYLR